MLLNLKQVLRQDFTQYVRPHFEKSECEVCNSVIEHLHVHHVTHFQDLLNETLEQLHLEYHEDVDMYSDEELELIRDIMIGKQMQIEYITCCQSCHLELHEGNFFKKKIVDKKISIDGNYYGYTKHNIGELEQILHDLYVNNIAFLNDEGKNELIEICNLYDNPVDKTTKITNINKINYKLNRLGLYYQISYETISQTTLYKITNTVTNLITKLEELVYQCETNTNKKNQPFIGKDGLNKIADSLNLLKMKDPKTKKYVKCTSVKAINDTLKDLQLPYMIEVHRYSYRENNKVKGFRYYTLKKLMAGG